MLEKHAYLELLNRKNIMFLFRSTVRIFVDPWRDIFKLLIDDFGELSSTSPCVAAFYNYVPDTIIIFLLVSGSFCRDCFALLSEEEVWVSSSGNRWASIFRESLLKSWSATLNALLTATTTFFPYAKGNPGFATGVLHLCVRTEDSHIVWFWLLLILEICVLRWHNVSWGCFFL